MHSFFFFFNDTATTEIYTLSLHDALPILGLGRCEYGRIEVSRSGRIRDRRVAVDDHLAERSEEHTSELQSQSNLVCRLLLEKKKYYNYLHSHRFYSPSHIHDSLKPVTVTQ